MEIVEVPVTNSAAAMSVYNGINVKVCVFNVRDYHQVNLLVRIEDVEDPVIPLCDVGLPHVTSLRALFHMYRFTSSCGT